MTFSNTLLAGLDISDEAEAQQMRDDLGLFFDGLFTFDIDLPGVVSKWLANFNFNFFLGFRVLENVTRKCGGLQRTFALQAGHAV